MFECKVALGNIKMERKISALDKDPPSVLFLYYILLWSEKERVFYFWALLL